MNTVKKTFFCYIFLFLVSGFASARQRPLANEGLRGLYARSIEQVLRLDERQIDLATAVLIISEQWNVNVSGRRYLAELDDMAYEIRSRIKERDIRARYQAIGLINDYLFEELGFSIIDQANNPDDLFLHSVLDSKRGYCLSLSILYLAIGERLGLPLYGVVVPGHFFVRYDDGRVRFNIEATSNGGRADDDHYINKFDVPNHGRDNIYMVNLNKLQSLGCFFNNLGNSYMDVGNLDQALVALKRATEINPSLAESRTNLGNVYLKLDRTKEAIYEYEKALEINPADAKTHNNLGNAYSRTGLHNQAIAEYERSLDLDPDFIDVYTNLAAAYSQIKMHDKALSLIRRAIELKGRDSGLYTQMANIYADMKRFDEAIDRYTKALSIGPATTDIYYGLAICCNGLGLADEEIRAYKNALAIDPDMVPALMNLGNAYFTRQDYKKAIELYVKAVRLAPEDHKTHYNLASTYFNLQDYAEAVREYSKAVEIEPKMADAHNGLGCALYNLKEYEKAWTHLRMAQELGAEIDKKLLEAIESEL